MKTLLLTLALLTLPSCNALRETPSDGGLRQQLIEFVTAAGDAAIRLKGTELLREHAPEMLPLLDRPTLVEGGSPLPPDGQVSLAEIVRFIETAEPAQLVMLGAIYFQ